ncbi:MAG: VPS10 domain-containing protein [Betaproteobacteria bacterium]
MLGIFRYRVLWACAIVAALVASDQFRAAAQPPAAGAALDPAILHAYQWRSIGPARGGRSIAVTGVRGRRNEGYFGAVGGGLWKTTDGGQNWTPVTDGQIHSGSVGAVAVSESNPDIVFIGTGESCIRGNIQPGDGVYKSTDAGKTWTHVGFSDSDAISKIRIHPTNPDIVFVADFGRYGKQSDERGVYKSTDGGKTWKRVLFRDGKTGAVDVEFDRRNPTVMYAALWEAYRVEYQMSSGGPGSGLFKSTDGGDTWTEITRHPGLPQGVVGKMTVSVSGADSNRVYLLEENAHGGLFVSDDAGATWKLVNDGHNIRQRAFYYTHVFADPVDKDTVYMLNTSAFRSTDGGKTLQNIGRGTHGDFHDLWIDPDDAKHVMIGNDGGGAITFDIAAKPPTWSEEDYATAQFYHVITTKHVPYHVCGAQQDNTTLCVPSDTGPGGVGAVGGGFGRIPPEAPYPVGGGEPGYIAPDPRNPDVFYSGANNGAFTTRLDRRTGELKEVGAYPRFFSGEPSDAVKERWQWTFPIIFSYVDPNVLYVSSQHVWKTTDGGQTWTRISGDLTRHDPKTMGESGGPITHDMNSPEIYATVFSLAPGKTDVNVIWAGSDDGLVHVTRDGGKTWTNVTPKDMPDLGRVSQIDGSAFDAGTAYMAVKKPLLEDYAPYIYRTHDFGRTWTKIVDGIAPNDYTHVVREDPTRKGLLYAGTEHGFYISYDDGDHWQSLRLNLPDTQVSDIWVEANDLAIATHGRGFYILDNIAALRQYGAEATDAAEAYLFKPGDAIHSAENATIEYWLKKPAQKLALDILDAKGQVIRSYTGEMPKKDAQESEDGFPRRGPQHPSMAAGLNRFPWDLRYESVKSFPGMILWGATTNGPMALPGSYQVRLTVDGQTLTQPVTIKKHPLRNISLTDLQTQLDVALQIRDKVDEANEAVIQIRRIKKDIDDRLKKKDDSDLRAIGNRLTRNLSVIEENVYQVQNQSNQDPLNFPIRINNRLASLLRVVETGDGAPTSNVGPIFEDIKGELKAQTDKLQQELTTDLPTFNRLAQRMGLEPVKEK